MGSGLFALGVFVSCGNTNFLGRLPSVRLHLSTALNPLVLAASDSSLTTAAGVPTYNEPPPRDISFISEQTTFLPGFNDLLG